MKLRCLSLFDITKTNVTSKKSLLGASVEEVKEWQSKRNTQCNFDTIVQVISLRAQPEHISDPIITTLDKEKVENFGLLYSPEQINCWYYDFTDSFSSVFSYWVDELGAL